MAFVINQNPVRSLSMYLSVVAAAVGIFARGYIFCFLAKWCLDQVETHKE
jgi:hypothetical protein